MEYIPYGKHWLDDLDIREINEVLRSDWLTTGPKVQEFERALCDYIGCRESVVVNSGTSALDIAVNALDIPEGSEVITTPLTFMASSNALLYNNLRPVYADISRDTRNIDPESIKKLIGPKTWAILYVDYAGHPCDIDEIREIADAHNLHLIEDASHALGAEYHHRKIGTLADMSILSFHPVKHITTGEGGAVTTDNKELAEKMRMTRSHGINKDAQSRHGSDAGYDYDMIYLGRNYRITDIQCALGISQLKRIDEFVERRNELASMYNDLLSNVPHVEIPLTKPDIKHAWHLYTVLLDGPDRDRFFRYMRSNNIGVNVHYIPIYKFTYYRERFAFDDSHYPVTEDVFNRIITLPLFPRMKEEELHYVCEKIGAYEE